LAEGDLLPHGELQLLSLDGESLGLLLLESAHGSGRLRELLLVGRVNCVGALLWRRMQEGRCFRFPPDAGILIKFSESEF